MTSRARYFLIGDAAIAAAVGLIGWHFFGGRGDVLKPDGGPIVTVMDFWTTFLARSAPLRLATSEILDTIADEHGLCHKGRGAEHAVRKS
jgi:hypothetical protein